MNAARIVLGSRSLAQLLIFKLKRYLLFNFLFFEWLFFCVSEKVEGNEHDGHLAIAATDSFALVSEIVSVD